MKPAYPELMESVQRVARVVKDEEHRYATTYQVAERVFQDEVRAAQNGVISGAAAFKLYDTYGLALDEQEEMAREFGLVIDGEGFEHEMENQRTRARASWKGAEKTQVDPVYQRILGQGKPAFLGYEQLSAAARVVAYLADKQEVVLDRTPFYAETGGQVGDRGLLYRGEEPVAEVLDTYYPVAGLIVHKVKPLGAIQEGDEVRAEVDAARRNATRRNHTATHLLHAALRQVLGKHVKQAGSVVEPGRLRFDFTHYTAVDVEELAEIERLANEQIFENIPVTTEVMDLDSAVSSGAMALFGEKYADRVRVVSVGDFSRELCGGTHVARTGDIGLCKVVNEGSISAGVRRIEAITGEATLRRLQESSIAMHRLAQLFKTSEADIYEQVERLQANQKQLERQVEQLKERIAQAQLGELDGRARLVKGVKVLAARVDSLDRGQMRTLADALRNKWRTGVVVLASADNGNVAIVSAVTKDLTSKVHAGKLAGAVAQAVGGKGGGRPDMAEAGGKDAAALGAALEEVYRSVEAQL
jgi:alanyl-tRNA synthetase